MLRLINITKQYNDEKVLDNLNISFKEKEFVSILAPSGSGKTTLLNIIGGLDTEYQGKVLFYNHNLKILSDEKLTSYRNNFVSFIFQDYNLIDILNVYDNIKLSLSIKNKDKKEIDKKINEALKILDIDNIKYKYPNELSGGQKQRVAVARSIVSNTNIILCDEVTSALDRKNTYKVLNILKTLSKEKLIIFITHNKKIAKEYSDRILYLNNGNIKENNINIKDKNIIFNKYNISKLNILKLSIKNILSHKRRTIITMFAFSISLISILLTMCITSSVNDKTSILEKEIIKSFPIIINNKIYKDDSKKNNNDKIYTYDKKIHENKITESLINILEKNNTVYYEKDINLNISTIDNKNIDNKIFNIFPINYMKESYDVLSGNVTDDKYKLIIEVNSKNEIDPIILDMFNIKDKELDINDILNKSIKLNNNNSSINLRVEAVIRPKHDSEKSFIYLKNNLINADIKSISIYLKNMDDKNKLVKEIEKYNKNNSKIIYQDLGEGISSSIDIVIKSITNAFVIFSFISLIISFFMIISMIYLSILENKKNIGIFKSLGMKNKDIANIFKYEFVIVSIFTSLFSIISIKILTIIIDFIINKIYNIKNFIILSFKDIFIISFISIITCILAIIKPLKKINKKNIKELLK